MTERLLLGSVLGLLAAFAGALALVLGHGLWLTAYRRWAGPRLDAAREALGRLVDDPQGGAGAAYARLMRLPAPLRLRAVVELARVVGGSARERLRRAAEQLGVVERAVRMTRARRWRTRLHGARILTRLGGGAEVMLPLFRDRSAAVRIQAAEWAAAEGGPDAAAALVVVLADGEPLCRHAVQDSLVRLGGGAVPALAEFLETEDAAAALRGLQVAAAIPDPAFLPAAVRLAASPDPRVRALAVEVLAALGGEAASDAVGGRLRDPDAGVRAAAAEAVARLGWWAAAGRVAPLLRDPAFAVRRSAALALWRLGSPGVLHLRRLRSDPDRYASDMARQVLDLGALSGEGGR